MIPRACAASHEGGGSSPARVAKSTPAAAASPGSTPRPIVRRLIRPRESTSMSRAAWPARPGGGRAAAAPPCRAAACLKQKQAARHPPDPFRAASGVVDTVVADTAIGSREAPGHRGVHADPVDAQRPRPRHRPLVRAVVSSAGRRISCTACTNSLRCSSGRRRRSIRKPAVRTYFIRLRRNRPPALPSSRTP